MNVLDLYLPLHFLMRVPFVTLLWQHLEMLLLTWPLPSQWFGLTYGCLLNSNTVLDSINLYDIINYREQDLVRLMYCMGT